MQDARKAVASLFEYPSLLHMADAVSREEIRFPYVPVFVSPGHLTGLYSSMAIVLQSLTRYRLPELIRRADQIDQGRSNVVTEFAGD